MPRTNRNSLLEKRTNRAKIAPRRRVAVAVGDGLALLYRRGADGIGTWQARRWNGETYTFASLGEADDVRTADGDSVLDYWQAFDRVRAWEKESAGRTPGERVPVPGRGTVGEACED